MADFQNILDQLKENNKGSEKASAELKEVIIAQTATRNRSIGASLALQFKRQNQILIAVQEAITGVSSTFKEQLEYQKDKDFETERAAQGQAVGGPVGGDDGDASTSKAAGGIFAKMGAALTGAGMGVMGAGIGIGAALAGVGIAAGGIAFLINVLGKPGLGKNIAESVEALLGIDPGNTTILKGLDIAGTMTVIALGVAAFAVGGMAASVSEFVNTMSKKAGGRDFATAVKEDLETLLSIDVSNADALASAKIGGALGVIGLGLIAFGTGKGIASVAEVINTFAVKAGAREFADAVKYDLETLLSINSDNADTLAALDIAGAMTAIGLGLLGFSGGKAIATVAEVVNTFAKKAGAREFADAVKYDMETLLSIDAGKASTLGAIDIAAAMTAIGVGLAVFGGGKGVASAAEIVAALSTKIGEREFADAIKEDIETLLSIDTGGLLDGVKLAANMTAIGTGLAVFGVGKGAAATAEIVASLSQKIGERAFADAIKEDIETLLSIEMGEGLDSIKFAASMSAIGIGLAVFAGGKGMASAAEMVSTLSNKIGDKTFAEGIKDDVETLLSITATEGAGDFDFLKAMTDISAGLALFAGAEFVSGLVGAATGILSFVSGEQSPIKKVLALAESADDLEKVGKGLTIAHEGLTKFSALKAMGDVGLLNFAEQMAESVPLIEAAIAGGTTDKTLGFWGGRKFLGLGSGKINYTLAIDNLKRLNDAFSLRGGQAASQFGEGIAKVAEGLDEINDKDLDKLETITDFMNKNALILGESTAASNVSVIGGNTQANTTQNNMNAVSVAKAIAANNDPSAAYAGTAYYG